MDAHRSATFSTPSRPASSTSAGTQRPALSPQRTRGTTNPASPPAPVSFKPASVPAQRQPPPQRQEAAAQRQERKDPAPPTIIPESSSDSSKSFFGGFGLSSLGRVWDSVSNSMGSVASSVGDSVGSVTSSITSTVSKGVGSLVSSPPPEPVPLTMQAWQLTAFTGPSALSLVSVQVPEVGPGQVLIRIEASVINPSDLMYLTGNYGAKPISLPARVGFEGCGRVVASGGGVMGWLRLGKRVAFYSPTAGAWAQYIAVPASQVISLPDDLPVEQAAAAVINPLTVVGLLSEASAGSHKAIVHTAAASQVGRMLVRVSRLRGIPVVNIVRKPDQVQLLANEGAQYTLLESDPAFNEKFSQLCMQLSATILFDAVGGSLTGRLLNLMPDRSVAVVYGGLSATPVSQVDLRDLIFRGKQVRGFLFSDFFASRTAIGQMAAVREASSLGGALATTFSGRVQLRDVPEAIQDYTKNMSAGKKLIVISS